MKINQTSFNAIKPATYRMTASTGPVESCYSTWLLMSRPHELGRSVILEFLLQFLGPCKNPRHLFSCILTPYRKRFIRTVPDFREFHTHSGFSVPAAKSNITPWHTSRMRPSKPLSRHHSLGPRRIVLTATYSAVGTALLQRCKTTGICMYIHSPKQILRFQ